MRPSPRRRGFGSRSSSSKAALLTSVKGLPLCSVSDETSSLLELALFDLNMIAHHLRKLITQFCESSYLRSKATPEALQALFRTRLTYQRNMPHQQPDIVSCTVRKNSL